MAGLHVPLYSGARSIMLHVLYFTKCCCYIRMAYALNGSHGTGHYAGSYARIFRADSCACLIAVETKEDCRILIWHIISYTC